MTNKLGHINQQEIENRIFTIRGKQVMLDSHLAELYQVETKVLNQAVKRNIKRFPAEFMFKLNEGEWDFLRSQFLTLKNENDVRSQNVTLEDSRGKHTKYLPNVFTEQGVAMLSSILRSDTAIKVSIKIITAFVEMRKLVLGKAALFQRLDKIERKQLEADEKFEHIFKALESKDLPERAILFNGQVFDAYKFVADLIR
ncbi:ORF6N domain-containing protein, partial [Bacteroidota bacterium]